jgi:NADH-quinone oxidoreductase subunit M
MFQRDLKSLIAYSSIVHMRFILLIILTISTLRKIRSLRIILSHGFVSAIIFFFIGEISHTSIIRVLYYTNSLFISNILLTCILSFNFFLNGGIPPRISFISEILGILS